MYLIVWKANWMFDRETTHYFVVDTEQDAMDKIKSLWIELSNYNQFQEPQFPSTFDNEFVEGELFTFCRQYVWKRKEWFEPSVLLLRQHSPNSFVYESDE